ncbi:MAG: hypothetical protein B6I35_07100 [Anaerolineaceae bacterium 4572_32.2]|nr:MAG: hypothetical protein B6I35_07100 [Anaerolineaceae bacterium 4572_32.2]
MPALLSLADSPASWCVIVTALLAAIVAYAFIEPGRLVVRRVDALIPGLPPSLDGIKIGQLSDLHRGPMMPRSRVERAVALLAAESPDMVALTGDFVSYWPGYAAEYTETLAPLCPRLGIFACTGNHEHWTDPDVVTTALREAGVMVLRNQHQLVAAGGATLCIIGIDDVVASNPPFHHIDPADDLSTALAGSPPSGVFRLLLAHNPDFVMESVFTRETARRPIHLVLSGHTHGGQVRLPLLGAPHIPSQHRQLFGGGLVRAAGTLVYVSRGAGSSWPMRFNCPPEVNIITLRAA